MVQHTPFEQKCILYNMRQVEIGSPLRTLKGSVIRRDHEHMLGKRVGNKLYLHKVYANWIMFDSDASCLLQLAQSAIEFDYNIIRWNAIDKELALEEVPDFDSSREPVVGKVLVITQNELRPVMSYRHILHHKWTMVSNTYSGFNVEESWEWSKKWLSTLQETANGNSQEAWEEQLHRFNLS